VEDIGLYFNSPQLPPDYSTENIPSLFSILQVSEETLFRIENKLILYKNIAPSGIEKLPYYRINLLVDEWLEDIEKQKKEKKKQEEEYQKAQQQSQSKHNFKQPKFPKPPNWKI